MSTTDKSPPTDRAAINRENARHSTGPRTPQGKDVSRLNAVRYGLCSQTVVSSKANLEAYCRFTKRYFDDLQPKGIVEKQLVQTLADTSWRLNCARAYETNLLTLGSQIPAAAVDAGDPEIDFALATAASYRNQAKVFSAISMHEQRVSREFHRTLKELRAIQAERHELEHMQKIEAALLYKMHNAGANEPTTPYNSTEDGFVLANNEIETFIRQEHRKAAARQAELTRAAPGGAGI